MRLGPLSPSELGVVALTLAPWFAGLIFAVLGTTALLRLARAAERIAAAVERDRPPAG